MDTWWIFVKAGVGHHMKVTVDAPNQWQAMQQLRAMYGSDKLIGEAAYDNSNRNRNSGRDWNDVQL